MSDHVRDEDCDVDLDTNCCRVCSVEHGDPCPDCGGRGYHRPHRVPVCLRPVPPVQPDMEGGICLLSPGHEEPCAYSPERRKGVRRQVARPEADSDRGQRVAPATGGAAEAPRLSYPAAADGGIVLIRHDEVETINPFGTDRIRITLKSKTQIILDRESLSRAAAVLLDPDPRARRAQHFYRRDVVRS